MTPIPAHPQHIYHNGTPLPVLTNGEFATNDNPSYNRHDGQVNDQYVIDVTGIAVAHELHIAAGNAAWGGAEMPKDCTLCKYVGDECEAVAVCADTVASSWETIDVDVSYAAPNGANDRAAAEVQTFPLPAVTGGPFFRLTVRSNWGNGSHAVIRQVSITGDTSAPPQTPPTSTANQTVDRIHRLCNESLEVFTELHTDRDTVNTCRTLLGEIHECGVEVASAIQPLSDQAEKIQQAIDGFAEDLQRVQSEMEALLVRMRTEADKVGPLPDVRAGI